MALNILLKSDAEQLADNFGGLDVVKQLVTQKYLENILIFPGFKAVVKPWSDPKLDLASLGYIPDSNYFVFNDQWEFLYESQTSSEFGWSQKDQELLIRATHGSYVYIQFENDLEPVVGLIWICNRLSPNQVQNTLNQLADQRKSIIKTQKRNELFIETSRLAQSGILKFYFLAVSHSFSYSPEEIIANPQTEVLELPLIPRVLLYPDKPGWYLFTHESEPGRRNILSLENFKGIGHRRLKTSPGGAVFLETSNINLSFPYISENSLPAQSTYTGWLQTDPMIRLEGEFGYFDGTIKITSSSQMTVTTPPNALINMVGSNSMLATIQARSSSFLYIQSESLFSGQLK